MPNVLTGETRLQKLTDNASASPHMLSHRQTHAKTTKGTTSLMALLFDRVNFCRGEAGRQLPRVHRNSTHHVQTKWHNGWAARRDTPPVLAVAGMHVVRALTLRCARGSRSPQAPPCPQSVTVKRNRPTTAKPSFGHPAQPAMLLTRAAR